MDLWDANGNRVVSKHSIGFPQLFNFPSFTGQRERMRERVKEREGETEWEREREIRISQWEISPRLMALTQGGEHVTAFSNIHYFFPLPQSSSVFTMDLFFIPFQKQRCKPNLSLHHQTLFLGTEWLWPCRVPICLVPSVLLLRLPCCSS